MHDARRTAFGLLTLAAVLGAGKETRAGDVLVLSPVTVEEQAPAEVVVSDKELERTQASSLSDIFRSTPTVTVSGGGQTAAQKFYVRGLEDTNLNVTIDGARQGGGFFRHQGNLSIGAEMLKQIEVEAGSGNALAGPGALGGAVRFRTKDAEDLLLDGQKNGALVKTGFHSNDLTRLVSTAVYGRPIEEVSYLFYGTKSWSEDYQAGGGGEVANTASTPFSGLAKVAVRPAPGQELKYTLDYRRDDATRTTRPNFVFYPADPAQEQEAERRSQSLSYALKPPEVPWLDLDATAYSTEGSLTLMKTSGSGWDREARWISRGIDLRNRVDLDPVTLTAGLDYSWDESRGRASQGTVATETGKVLGLYAQGDLALTDAWTLTAGLRFDHTTLIDLENRWHEHTHLSPSLSTRYQITPAVGVFASWSEAFRGPRPLQGTTLLSGQAASSDPDVDGEVSQTVEAGLDLHWNGWSGSVVGFRTHVEDTIVYGGQMGRPFNRQNGDDLTITGVNVGLGYGRETWDAKITYAHEDMRFGNRPLSAADFTYGAPQGDRFGIDLRARIPQWDVGLGWTSTVVLDLTEVPSGYPDAPGYAVHDASVTWTPSERYQIALALNNIFDRKYMNQTTPYWSTSGAGSASDLYERGRDFRLSATMRF
ncbi:TonB-dependent receptor domain-containing protein [Pararhodospirillum oryzae]|uniref:TonB-dependent receptor n=1 Tax=Pararhodospirillum oryzae TaxID=478448 RepID=A0A512HC68_9PROT|nr:TonB-dependent receptor [Pararhodospirillum oryzae]GEO83033.1 TonB-dependent receptor [Pararhodospirillum oryzae]